MRRLISFVFFTALAVPFLSYSQTLFNPKTTLLTKSNQRDFVLAADFDNDGDQDMLTLHREANPGECCGVETYYLVYNDGTGGFEEEVLIKVDEIGWDNLQIGDVDQDGLQDIVVYESERTSIRWLRNAGEQEFTWKESLVQNYFGGTFEVRDVIGNAAVDLLYTDGDQILVMENTGDGTFLDPVMIAEGEFIRTADFDADGLLDVFTLEETNSFVVWHQNQGDGTFTADTTNIENEIPFFTPDLLVSDFTGDNQNEIIISYNVAGDQGAIAPQIYRYEEGAEFILQENLSDPEQFELSPSMVSMGDLDQDGDLDILASFWFAQPFSRIESESDEFVGWFENQGNFQFTPRLLDEVLQEGYYVDVNNDQSLDIILDTSNELIWQANRGAGSFAAPAYLTNSRALPMPIQEEGVNPVSFGDLNQDGFAEMIVLEEAGNKLHYFLNTDSVLVSPPALIALNTLQPAGAAVFDVNGDQMHDILTIGGTLEEGLDVYLYPNTGNLTFGPKDTLFVGAGSTDFMPGDFNGDGLMDIALSDDKFSPDEEILLLSNQGNQTFNVVKTGIIGDLQGSYDVDGDAKTEIITTAGIYAQNAEGSFTQIRELDFPFTDMEDINGDKLMDFLAVSPDEITLFLANEDGSYQEQTLTFDESYDFTNSPWILVDVDMDQDKDMVFIRDTGTNRELAYLLNINSTTVFGEYTVIDSFDDTNFRLFSHDIDQDTDTDLVVLTDTELVWYQGSAYEAEEEVPENTVPTVANPIEDQQVMVNEEFSLTIGEDVFADADEGDTLTLSVALSDSTELPDWLTFDTSSNTLSGTPPKAGVSLTIRVTATDTAMASVSDEFTLTVDTGENPITSLEEDIVREVRVYPVPTSSMLFLESEQPGASLQSYQLTDIQGKVLKQRALSQNGTNSIRIDVSSLVKGIYLLEIQTPEKTYQQRILIE